MHFVQTHQHLVGHGFAFPRPFVETQYPLNKMHKPLPESLARQRYGCVERQYYTRIERKINAETTLQILPRFKLAHPDVKKRVAE